LRKPQQSEKQLKRECQRCTQRVERLYACQLDNKCIMACADCVPIINAENEKVVAEKRAERLIPTLFQEARIEHLSEALQARLKFLPDNKGLFLWGKQGVGKSYAMAALMREFILKGSNIARISYEMLCLQLRDTYKPRSPRTELDVVNPLLIVDKLFIEDVGTTVSAGQQESDFSLRTFLVLLNQRLEACKPTFITTNKNIEELGRSFDQRVASRLQEACEIIHLTGEDRRATKGGQNNAAKQQET